MEQFSSARHHLGFYNNVGLTAQYKISTASVALDVRNTVYRAVADVIQKHPILSTIPIDEDTPNPYFARLPVIDLSRTISFVTRSQEFLEGTDVELDALLQDQHNTNFKADYGTLPFWRVIILQSLGVQTEFTACFIFHHSLGDGASGLVFHKFLSVALNNAETTSVSEELQSIVKSPETPLLPSLENLHTLPVPVASNKSTTTPSLKGWTGKAIQLPCATRFRSLSLSAGRSRAFINECKKNSATVTSALPALITSILFQIVPPATEALSCVIPVSLRRWLPSEITNDAMGVWIDAFQVQFPRSNHDEASGIDWQQAYHCQTAIKIYLSHNGTAINVARFKNIPNISSIFTSKIGQARDSAFEVSNLGVFDAPIVDDGWEASRVVFSRSAFASGSAIAVSVVSGGDGAMSLGFTWQEGVVEEEVMEKVIGGIKKAFMSESE
jgi:hypothetical protein